MAEDKKPSVLIKQKQKEHDPAAQLQNIWFAKEAPAFAPPERLPNSRHLRILFSNKILDIRDGIQNAIIHELETGLGFNLLPIFLSIGILVYFTIPAEPSAFALFVSLLALSIIIWKLQFRSKTSKSISILTAIIGGMLVAQTATNFNHTAVLERQKTAEMKGVILAVDQNRRGAARYLIKPVELGDLGPPEIPNRIRVSATAKHERMFPGDAISGLVRLQPVSGPVFPGGYDFSFFAWHEGMGGSGFFMGRPNKIAGNYSLSFAELAKIKINNVRNSIENRILNAMPKNTGKIAVALVTGNKTHIPDDVQSTLRKTGLAHILAISGLHMALVTLTVIWIIRFGLVLIPSIALRYPVKKYSVCAGFFSATTYLLLSGAGVATQRAWVMISVMLLAVLMDRRAITMRSVAISALIILFFSPQSLLSPGFQMSFAAVTALVAGYEALNKRKKQRAENTFIPINQNHLAKLSTGLIGYFAGITTTSLIAGTATAFVAAWHFHQVAPLGLLANLIAMPIVSIIIMPFVLFSVLLMPYGLEFIPLISVSTGIEWVVEISSWVEGLSPDGNTGLLPRNTILIFGAFLTSICVLKTKLRLFGLAPLVMLPIMLKSPVPPDVIISENGRAIAIKTDTQKLGLLYPRGSAFVQNIWLKAWSGGEQEKLNLSKDQCNRERCIVVLPSSKVLHVVYNPELLQSSCGRADILIAPRLWWVNCKFRNPELILKRYDFERFGAHALYIKKVTQKAKNENKKLNPEILIEKGLPTASRPWHRNVRHPDEVKKF